MENANTKKNGGARPGAGRPKGSSSIIMERARAYALQRIEAEFKPIMDAAIELSKGIWVESPDGKRVYKKAPDVNALKHTIDQIIGKPKESMAVEHSGQISLAELLGRGALDRQDE